MQFICVVRKDLVEALLRGLSAAHEAWGYEFVALERGPDNKYLMVRHHRALSTDRLNTLAAYCNGFGDCLKVADPSLGVVVRNYLDDSPPRTGVFVPV